MCFSHYLSVSVVSPCLVKFCVCGETDLCVKSPADCNCRRKYDRVRSDCNVVLRGQNCGPRHILSAERL